MDLYEKKYLKYKTKYIQLNQNKQEGKPGKKIKANDYSTISESKLKPIDFSKPIIQTLANHKKNPSVKLSENTRSFILSMIKEILPSQGTLLTTTQNRLQGVINILNDADKSNILKILRKIYDNKIVLNLFKQKYNNFIDINMPEYKRYVNVWNTKKDMEDSNLFSPKTSTTFNEFKRKLFKITFNKFISPVINELIEDLYTSFRELEETKRIELITIFTNSDVQKALEELCKSLLNTKDTKAIIIFIKKLSEIKN